MKKITDKMRLNFLAKQKWPATLAAWAMGAGTEEWRDGRVAGRVETQYGVFLGVGKNPRAAIDEAIVASRKKR